MWKAAFTGRSDSGKSGRDSGDRRKKSSGRSGDSVTSAPAAGSSRRDRDRDGRDDEREHRRHKSSKSGYGDDDTASRTGSSIYATAPTSRAGTSSGPPALTESTLRMLNDDDGWEDESVAGKSEKRSRRSGEDGLRRKKSSRSEKRSRSRSRSRDRQERREQRRREREGAGGYAGDREKTRSSVGKDRDRDGERGIPAMGSFEQFPGQFAGGPAFEYGNGAVASGQNDYYMSGGLPTADAAHQFPDQNPSTYTRPQMGPNRADSYGHAADYYLDQGQSVQNQPGVRSRTPNMLANPDTHLVAASSEANPAQDTGNGTAADFYGGKVSPVPFTAEPDTIGPSSKPSKPGRASSGSSSKPSKLGKVSAAAAGAAGMLSSDPKKKFHRSVTDPSVAASNDDLYTSSVQVDRTPTRGASARGDGDSFYGTIPGQTAQPGATRGENDSYYAPGSIRPAQSISGDTYYSTPSQQSPRPGTNMQGSSGKSNANLAGYATTAAGAAAAGYAAYDIKNRFDEKRADNRMDSQSFYGTTQTPQRPGYATSAAGMSSAQLPPRPGYLASPGRGGGMMGPHMHNHHEHRGPISRFKDGLLNLISSPEDVAKMEDYTEYIGVCKYCFDPRSTSFMAPRKHHYDPRRRRSNDTLRRKGSGDSLKQRVDKESRYYAQTDSKWRRSSSFDKSDMLAAGLGAAGLAAGANALFNDKKNFDDVYSVKSGHRASSAARRRSRSSSREQRRRGEYGIVGGKEPRADWVTVRTKDGRIEKRRVHHSSRSRSRSRSKSQNRRSSGLGGVAAGAALGAAGAAAMHHRRSSSPNGAFVRPHQSRSRSSSSSSGSRSPGLGEIFGFTERKPRRGRRSPASSRRSSNAEGGGFFGGFFSPTRSNERKPRKGSRGHKKSKSNKGFFTFSNGSGSSSDPDMAFGGSEVFQSKESLPLRRKGSGRRVRRKSSDKHIAATVAGIGATAAALSAASKGNRVSKRGSRPELGPKRHSKRVGAVDSETEDDWEDELPSDADDASSVDDGLAFGGSTLSHRQSIDSISSGDGLSAWGWRWGGKDKKRDRRVSKDAKLPSGHPDSFPIGQVGSGMAAGAAAAGMGNMLKDDAGQPLPTANPGRTPSVSSNAQNQQPMQYVDPRPVSEAGSKISSMPGGWDLDEPVVSRPGPGPIQQPKPVAPVSPAFVRDEDMTRERPMPRRTASSPVRSSFGLSDAAAIGAGALAAGSIIAGSSSGRKSKDQVGNVRFGLTEEQQRKEDRQERRQSGKDDEDRRRADRTRALKEEAERFAKEEDARKREEEVGRKREEENRRAAEIRGERERIEAERREEERKLQMRREQEDAYHQEQARFAEDARRQEESNRQREAQAAEEAAKARREAEIRDDVEREQASRRSAPSSREGSRSRKGSKSSSAPWGQVAAGAAAAATVGAVVAGSKHQRQRGKDADGERERGQYPEGEALYHPIQDDKSNYASRQIKPNDGSSGSPMMDDDLYDRDFFNRKRSNSRQARSDDVDPGNADQVVADMDDYYQAPAPSQAEFFAPKDILSQPSGGKTKAADAHDDNQVQVWHATESDDPSSFPHGAASGKSKHAPYGVPALNVIAPTPPGSVTSSVKGKGSMPSSPLAQAQDAEDVPEPAGRRRSRSISWGENKTHNYDPPTPDSHQEREAYIRDHDIPQDHPAKPEGNVDEIVVEPEDGERRAYGESEFPREGETPPLYQKPFAESVSDFTAFPVDSPGTEGMPAVRGYVEGETDEPTPAFEKPSHMPGAFDDDVYGETMSMAQEAGRAREEAEIADTPKAVEEPAWEPPLTKKEKKKREKAAKKGAAMGLDANEEPSTPTAGAAEVELPPSEPTETPRDDTGATVQEDTSDYFPAMLSKKDKKKREKALARGEPDPFAPDVGQSREAEANSEAQAVESSAPEPQQEPAFEMPKLSKKDQKKREKALARGEPDPFAPSPAEEAKDVDVPTESPPAAEPQAETEVQPEAETDMPKLSKKDQKKREKALARGEPDPFAANLPSVANEEETQTKEQSFETPSAEAEPEAEFEAPKLSKKEQKKRDKEAQKQGFADAAAMAAAGVAGGAAIAGIASTDEQPEDDLASTSSSKKGKKGKEQVREESFSDAWDTEQGPEARDAVAPEASDPFKDEPATSPQEGDPFAEFSDTKKSKKKKKRDSGRFNEPAASSPLRSEWNYNDYIGEQSTGGAEKITTAEPESYVNGDGQPSDEFPSQDAEYGSQRDAAGSSRQKSPERRSRSVASEPVEDRRKASRSKARSDFGYADDPDYFDDSRSVAASEPADVSFASERAAKRRSRREDDDNVSVTSSRSRRDRDPSPVEKKKKGGLFSLFSRKSTDSVPLNRTTSRDSRNGDEEDGERKHRRRKHREGSINDEDDDTRSTTSESRRRHRSSRDEDSKERRRSSKYDDVLESRSEPGGRPRSRNYDDEDHRSPVSESGHRHHRRRRTDEDRDSKDHSFLGSRVEHLPPLPDSQQESSAPAQASTEQDIGTPASAGAVDSAPDNGVKSAPDVALEDSKGLPDDEDTKTVIEPSPLPNSQPREAQRGQEAAVDDLPALPTSRPESPTSLTDITSRQTSPARPKSSTAVPLRFPFGQQSKERSASFGGTTPASPTTPTSKQKKPRPSSTEIRPLYLVERNRPTPEVEETLPSLPSSKPSSRASSVQGSDEWHSAAEDFSPERNRSLTIDTDHANAYKPDEDYLDSQQTTPKAVELPQDTEPKSERQEPQFYTWADFERDERLHSGAPEPQTSHPPTLGEPFHETSRSVDEKTLPSSEEPAPQEPERSEQDHQGGAMEAVAGAAMIGGAAALGYHALKEDKFEDATSGHEGEQAAEGDQAFQTSGEGEASASRNLEIKNLESDTQAPSQEQSNSSKKKKKGKKGKKGAAEDVLNEAEAEAVHVAPSSDIPQAAETEPGKDADITGAENTQYAVPEPSSEQQDQATQFESSRSVEDPEALQRSPDNEGQKFPAEEQLGQDGPSADGEPEGVVSEPKLNRKQAKKAKKKHQHQAWEPEEPEQQAKDESEPQQPAVETRGEQQVDEKSAPLVETPLDEAKVPEEPQEDGPSAQAEDASSSKSKKKSKKDKKKAKRQETEEDFSAPNEEMPEPPRALEDHPAGDDLSAPMPENAAQMQATATAPEETTQSGAEEPTTSQENTDATGPPADEAFDDSVTQDLQTSRDAEDLPAPTSDQPSDDKQETTTDTPELARDDGGSAKAKTEPENLPEAASAVPEDEFAPSSKKSKKNKKAKKAAELAAAAAGLLAGEDTKTEHESAGQGQVPPAEPEPEPAQPADENSGAKSASTFEDSAPPAEPEPDEHFPGTEVTSAEGNAFDDEPPAPSKKKGKKAKKSKMVGAWPGEESTESSQAQTPDEEKAFTEPAAEEDLAPDAATAEEPKPAQEPQAEDAESFWNEPTTKKKGKKGKKSKQQTGESLVDTMAQTDADTNAAPEEPADPVEATKIGEASTEQPTFERANPEENPGERSNIEGADQTAEVHPPEEFQQLSESQNVEAEWPTSSSSKKKGKKAKKAKKSADALPEEPSETPAEPAPMTGDSFETQESGEIKSEEVPQGLDAGSAGEDVSQQPADNHEGVKTETRMAEESKESAAGPQDPLSHGQAPQNEGDFTSEQEPAASGLATESAGLERSSQEKPPQSPMHPEERSPALQLSGEEASRAENPPDEDVTKPTDQLDPVDQASEDVQPSKKNSKKGKKAKAAAIDEIEASEQIAATEPAEPAEPQEAAAETQDQQILDVATGPTEADASTEWAEPTSGSKKKKKGKKSKKDAQDDGKASEEPQTTIPETQPEPLVEAQAEVRPEVEAGDSQEPESSDKQDPIEHPENSRSPEEEQESREDVPLESRVAQDSPPDGGLLDSNTGKRDEPEPAPEDELAAPSGGKKKGKKGKKTKSFALDDDENAHLATAQNEETPAPETPATQEANAEAEWSEEPTGKKKKKGKKSKQADAAVPDIPQEDQELRPVEDQHEAEIDQKTDAALENFDKGDLNVATAEDSKHDKDAEAKREMIDPEMTHQASDAPVDQEYLPASKDTDQNLNEVPDEQRPVQEVYKDDQPAEEEWPSFQAPSKKKKGKKGKKAALEEDVPSASADNQEDGGKTDQAADSGEWPQVTERSMDPLSTANDVPAGDELNAEAEKQDPEKPLDNTPTEDPNLSSTSATDGQQNDQQPNEHELPQIADNKAVEHISDTQAQTSEKAEEPLTAIQQDDQQLKGESPPEEDLSGLSSKSKKKKAKKGKKAALESEAPAATFPDDNEAVGLSQDATADAPAEDNDAAPVKSEEPVIATHAGAEERETPPSQLEDEQTEQGKEHQQNGNEERPDPSFEDASGWADALSEPHQSLQESQASKDPANDTSEEPQAQDADPESIWSEPQSTKKGKKEKKSKKQKAESDASAKPADEDAFKDVSPKEEEATNDETGPAEQTPHSESFDAQQPREPDAEGLWAEAPSSKKNKKSKKAKKQAAFPEDTEAALGEHAPSSDIPQNDKEGTTPEVQPDNLDTQDTQAAEASEANDATAEDIWSMPQNGKASKKAKKSKKSAIADAAEVAGNAPKTQQNSDAFMEPASVEPDAPVNDHGNEHMPGEETVSEAKTETADDIWTEPQTGKKGKKAKKAKKQAASAQSEPDPSVEQKDPPQSADQEFMVGAQKTEPSTEALPFEEVSNEAQQEEPSQEKEAEKVADKAELADRAGTVHEESEAGKRETTTAIPNTAGLPEADNLEGREVRSEIQDGAANDQEPEPMAVAPDEPSRDATEHSHEPTMEEDFATTKKSKKDKKKAKKAQEAAAAHFLDHDDAAHPQQESRFDDAGENAVGGDADVPGALPTTAEENEDIGVPDTAQKRHDNTNVGEDLEPTVKHADTEQGRRASMPDILYEIQAENKDATPSQADNEIEGTERTGDDAFAGSTLKRSKKEKRKAKKSGNAPDVEEPLKSSGLYEDTSMEYAQQKPEEGSQETIDAEPDKSARDAPNQALAGVGDAVPMADQRPAEGDNSIGPNVQQTASDEVKEDDPGTSSTKKSKKEKRKAKKSSASAFVDEDLQDAPPEAQFSQEQYKPAEVQGPCITDQETPATAAEDQAALHEPSTVPAHETQFEREEQPFVDQAGQDGSNDAVNDPGDQPTLSTKKAKKKEKRKAKKADLETPANDEPDTLPDRDDGIPQHDVAQDQAPLPEDGLTQHGGSLEGQVAATPEGQLQQAPRPAQPQAEPHFEKEQAAQAEESDFARGQESQDIPSAAQDEWPATPSKQTKKEKRKAKKAGKAMTDTDTNEPSQAERLHDDEHTQPIVTPATDDMLVETNKGLDEGIGTDTRDQAPPDDKPANETDFSLSARQTPASDLAAAPAHEDLQDSQNVSQGHRSPSRDIDFAATLAAGLADSGFDPDLVVRDPNYHRRASPPATMAEADPGEVSAATTTKRGKKAEKDNAEVEGTGEMAPATNDREVASEASGEDIDAAIAQSLQTAGFDPSVLSRASPSNDNSTFNEVGEDPSFSFTTSNKKKKKKGRQTADESEQTRSLETVQPEGSDGDGLPSVELASAPPQERQPLETDNQDSKANMETMQNTEDLPPPTHDAGADIYLAGDRDMDVDEMDKAYSAYKKKEKRKKKKSKAMGQDDQNSTPTESGVVTAPTATSLPLGEPTRGNESTHPGNGPEGLLHTSEVTQSLPHPTDGQRGNFQSEKPSWSFDALDRNVEDKPERDPFHGEQRRAFDTSPQSSPTEAKSSADRAARPSASRESLRGRRSAEPLHISTDDNSDNWNLDVQKQRTPNTRTQISSGEAARTPLESTSKNRASYLFQSPQDNTAGLPMTPENRRLRGPPSGRNESEASGFSPGNIGPTSERDALQAIPEERRIVRTGEGNQEDDAGSRSPRPRSSLNGVSSDAVRSIDAPNPTKPLSTDHLINRLSWPAVDEDSETVNMNRSLRMKPSKRTISDQRSPSAMSSRSNMSAGHQLRSPDELRSFSRASNRSLTPTLRRMDRSTSGDLRAASRRSDTGSAVGVRSSTQTIPPFQPPPTPPLNDEDVIDGSAARAAAMSDVFQGYGDAQGSQASPTRPPSVRKRQSMHITELESKLDQLTAENQALHDARQDSSRFYMDIDQHGEISTLRETVEARDLDLQRKDAEISQIRAMLQPLQQEVAHLTEINGGLTEANRNLVDDTNGRYGTLQQEHANVNEQWQSAQRELEILRQEHGKVTSGMRGAIEQEIASALAEKNAEILRLREELDMATEQIRALQVQIQSSKSSDFLRIRDEDYFDGACQKLCQHVQQWVLRFSKLSDNRICRFSNDIKDEKVEARLDNAILDGSDVDKLLGDRVRRRDVFMSVVMTMVWEYVFTRYLFGMDREQRQKLKALEKILAEVGPPRAVAQWRATTLTLLSKRPDFSRQCGMDTEAVAGEIFALLCQLLPPPSNAEQQLFASLQKVIGVAVDLSIEMRTQRSEYIMLPPLQPEYDRNGDLVRKVHFNSSLMNERSGMFGSNAELEKDRAVVKIVLFPLVVKKGDELGEGEEEIVVCPAQVLVHNEGARGKKVVRVMSGAMEIDDPRRSKQSLISSQPGSVAF